MVVAGLIVELVLPGGILVGAALLLAWGFDLAPVAFLIEEGGGIAIMFGVVAAYLGGLVAREMYFVVPNSAKHHARHLQKYWGKQALALAAYLSTFAPELWREPEPTEQDDGQVIFTEAWTADFVGILRDYLLATCQGASAQLVMYEWNLARLARNAIFPLWALSASCMAIGLDRIVEGHTWLGGRFVLAAIAAGALALLLRRVYRVRLEWHLEVLIRTGCSLFGYQGSTPK